MIIASKIPVDSAGSQLAALLLNAQKLSFHLLNDKLQGKKRTQKFDRSFKKEIFK